jgi:hypothetical protein
VTLIFFNKTKIPLQIGKKTKNQKLKKKIKKGDSKTTPLGVVPWYFVLDFLLELVDDLLLLIKNILCSFRCGKLIS